MAKSNAQRQREWRERQKAKRECTYGGCGNPVEPPHTICDDHRKQAREARRGSVRQLQGQVYDLEVENSELRGRIAGLETLIGLRDLQARHDRLLEEHTKLQEDFEEVSRVLRWYVWKEQQDAPPDDGGPFDFPSACC